MDVDLQKSGKRYKNISTVNKTDITESFTGLKQLDICQESDSWSHWAFITKCNAKKKALIWKILPKDTCVIALMVSSLGLRRTLNTLHVWSKLTFIVTEAPTCAGLQVCNTTTCAKWTCLSTWADYESLNAHWIQVCVSAGKKWQVKVIRVSGGRDNSIKWRLFQQETVEQLLFKVKSKVSLKFSDEKAHNTAYRAAIFHQTSQSNDTDLIPLLSSYYKGQNLI